MTLCWVVYRREKMHRRAVLAKHLCLCWDDFVVSLARSEALLGLLVSCGLKRSPHFLLPRQRIGGLVRLGSRKISLAATHLLGFGAPALDLLQIFVIDKGFGWLVVVLSISAEAANVSNNAYCS
ncbi:hypothetical protein GBA52_009058 [Prunus armeniaca]|nr:hypothetical protein GBA52_009058 [Prunus armeniaca]